MRNDAMDKLPSVISALLKMLVILVAAVSIAGRIVPIAWASPDAHKPSIIFILTDDHRWDALSKLGPPVVETPRLDRLSDEGVHWFYFYQAGYLALFHL